MPIESRDISCSPGSAWEHQLRGSASSHFLWVIDLKTAVIDFIIIHPCSFDQHHSSLNSFMRIFETPGVAEKGMN
jgi:hypothetical protein